MGRSLSSTWSVISASAATETIWCFFFQAEDGMRARTVTGVQTCALPIYGQGSEESRGDMDGALRRPLGRKYAGRRRNIIQRSDVVRPGRELPQRRASRRRAIYADGRRCASVRGDNRGSQGVHAPVEDEHAPLPPSREERADSGVQMHRVLRRAPLWSPSQEAEPLSCLRDLASLRRDDRE